MKTNLFMTLAVTAAMLASCSNDENIGIENGDGEVPAVFSAQVKGQTVKTRVVDTQWTDGDAIGIFAMNDDYNSNETYKYPDKHNYYENGKYVHNNGSWAFETVTGEVEKPYYFKNPYETAVTFNAYYPWQPKDKITAATDVTLDFEGSLKGGTIAVDASDQAEKERPKFDFMFSNTAAKQEGGQAAPVPTGSKAKTNVKFYFTHSMVKLVFKLVPVSENGTTLDYIETLTPTLKDIKCEGTFSLKDGTVNSADKTVPENGIVLKDGETTAAKDSDPGYVTFTAIVVPQSAPKNCFLTLKTKTAGGINPDTYLTKQLFKDQELVAGNQYTYTLNIKKMALSVETAGQVSIEAWKENTMGEVDDATLQ